MTSTPFEVQMSRAFIHLRTRQRVIERVMLMSKDPVIALAIDQALNQFDVLLAVDEALQLSPEILEDGEREL